MATVNFLYRSTRKQAPLNLRLLFSYEGKKKVISGKTQKVVSKDYWEDDHNKQRIKDIERAEFQKEVLKHNADLESYILENFYTADPNDINKDWLNNQIQLFYNPEKDKKQAPTGLIKFFDFYTDIKKNDLSETRKRRLKIVKRKVKRFEDHTGKTITISQVNDTFKNAFLDFGKEKNYSKNTLKSDFSVIKTVCTYAQQWDIKTSPQLKNLKVKAETIKSPYLNPGELERIKELDFSENERLDNARDWLLISCYTGQRVSDFMRFTPEMITKQDGNHFLELKQQKTGKQIVIPFLKEARDVFKKRNGGFPRAITPERYNDYIKEVCEAAGLKEKVKGKRIKCIVKDKSKATRNDYRKETGYFEKWRLVSSHIGRRSFASNFYGKVPTNYLIKITGHSTEKMFLNYIHKSEADTAKDAFKYFE
jgi:site-specific recombinase XerD